MAYSISLFDGYGLCSLEECNMRTALLLCTLLIVSAMGHALTANTKEVVLVFMAVFIIADIAELINKMIK